LIKTSIVDGTFTIEVFLYTACLIEFAGHDVSGRMFFKKYFFLAVIFLLLHQLIHSRKSGRFKQSTSKFYYNE